MKNFDAVIDLGWGSSGKGGIAGYLAMRKPYKSVVCAYGRQAGHTYNNEEHGIHMMVQQLPVGIVSESVETIFIGPGAIIHPETLLAELDRYAELVAGKRLIIHEHAAIVTDKHAETEMSIGQTKMGSTGKGVGQAMINRILRDPKGNGTAKQALVGTELECFVASRFKYDKLLRHYLIKDEPQILIEGAQGFGLSMYHGDYPYVTSRDVTPGQLFVDCAMPWQFYDQIKVIGVTRTRPIRVNNRDGFSGPCYSDQHELSWEEVGVEPEKTTVTQLERRIFSFSKEQLGHAGYMCLREGDEVALTFCDYIDIEEFQKIKAAINSGSLLKYVVDGPDDSNVRMIS